MNRPRCLACAAIAAVLMFGWQWITVHVNYGGNWTALYCTGAQTGVPASLAAEKIYRFPGSSGFDGQMYHYVAHDPLMRSQDLRAGVDAPWLRYRRILLPGLAWLLSCGQSPRVDPAYYALVLAFGALGAYWTAACCQGRGFSAMYGLLFLLLPATLIGMDRLVVDIALAALAAGFALHVRAPSWRLFVILAAAALARETGFLLLAAWCLYLLLRRRPAQAVVYALAAIPALAWYAYVYTRAAPAPYGLHPIPLSAIWLNWTHPLVYPPGMQFQWLAVMGDRLALAGMMAAFALAIYWNIRRPADPVALAALAYVAMGVFLQKNDHWTHIYDYGRVYSPVLLFLGLQSFERRSWAAVLPFVLILPRIGMQFGKQALGIVESLR